MATPPSPPPKRPPPRPEGLQRASEELGPRPGEPTPLRRPGAPTRPQDEPTVYVDPEPTRAADRPAMPAPDPVPQSRKDSPAGGIAIQGKGWKITMPHVALVAVLTTLGGWFSSKAVSKGESAEVSEVLTELRGMRKDVKDLQGDIGDVREDQRRARSNDTKILNYVEDTFTPMLASMRKLGVKFSYAGREPDEVEFHPAPMQGSNAPPIQPKAVLPERPSL